MPQEIETVGLVLGIVVSLAAVLGFTFKHGWTRRQAKKIVTFKKEMGEIIDSIVSRNLPPKEVQWLVGMMVPFVSERHFNKPEPPASETFIFPLGTILKCERGCGEDVQVERNGQCPYCGLYCTIWLCKARPRL